MRPFTFSQAPSAEAALQSVVSSAGAEFFAGGTTLLDLMKLDVIAPSRLVDISRLPFSEIEVSEDGITVGANVRNAELASHPAVRARFPVLSEALLAGASAQLRNMATTAGNLMQRTRCAYFREPNARCNKRTPGAGCDAITGFNRSHAVLGVSDHCIATHASDMCVALTVLNAVIETQRPDGSKRRIPINDFHLLPGDTPQRETVLDHGELITHLFVPNLPAGTRSHYAKVRDRASYEFALASAAVAIQMNGPLIARAAIGLGGIATKPWRSTEAEAALTAKPPDHHTFQQAAEAALATARPREHNAFKTELAKRTLIYALEEVASRS